MKLVMTILPVLILLHTSAIADTNRESPAIGKKTEVAKSPSGSAAVSNQQKPTAASASTKPAVKPDPLSDTLAITARLIEIPGKFAPNDLYNYVYVMKYRVVKVLKGAYPGQEILIGHYNPLIPRKQIQDKMTRYAAGDVTKFKVGDIHRLVLIKPIERVWKDAVEDEYFDSDLEKYYALRSDIVR